MKEIFVSLNVGEVSPLMACRLDVERRAAGMEEVKNLLVLEHGGVAKRPGMEMVKAVATADEGSRLVPHEAKMTAPAVLWMFDRRLYTVRHGAAVPDAFTATAFSGAAARDLQYTQVNDIVFCAHPEVHPFRLELAPGAAQVALKELTLTQQPWETLVQQEATVQYVPAGTGVDDAVTLKADRDLFTAAMAGKEWIRLTIHCNEYTARMKAEPDYIGDKNDVGTAVYHEPGARMYQEVADGTGLERLAPVFAAAGRKYGVDPDLLMAISMHETGNGTSSAFRNKRNAMGVSDSKGPRTFGSVEESIFYMARQLKRNYLDKGLSDVASIGAKYAPPGAENDPGGLNAHWVSSVNRNLKAIKG